MLFIAGWAGCTQPRNETPSVLHLFTDAQSITGGATLHDFDETDPPLSRISYPHNDALWRVAHQGKQALRFESTVLGQLRGSLHLFHQAIPRRDFQVSLNTWLELEMEEAWSGIVFWMANHIHQAAGIRWKANGIQKTVTLEIFTYRAPELRTLKSTTFPIQTSRWAPVQLQTQGQAVVVQFDREERLRMEMPAEAYLGNHFGLFQGEGTGYTADLQIDTASETLEIEVFKNWNREMLNTAKAVVSDHFTTPENTLNLPVPVRRVALANEWRSVVPVQCPSELRFEVRIPNHARLHTGFGILQPFALSTTQAAVEVWIQSGGDETLLARRVIQPGREPAQWFKYHDIHVSLQEYADRDAVILLRITPLEGDDPLVMCWSEPIITSRSKAERPNVLLFMVDTLRADRLGVYGNDRGLTPVIDAFSRTGTAFLNTISQAPWTTPSHASLFTGLYPSETNCAHTSNSGKNLLREGYFTWAELLQENGYATGAFTSGIQVRGELGFHQGFDTYREIDYDASYSIETLYERFRSWLDEYEDVPWFSFIHTYAVHFPYKHEQYDDYRTFVRSWEDRRRHQHDTYNGGVRFIDEWFGVFLRELERRGELDNTIIIFTSDHGESLGDRLMPRPARHGHWLYDDLLKVPLILSAPREIARNRRVENQVRLIDLLPTVMDLVGIETPAWCHGLSLIPLIQGKESLQRPALSEGVNYGFPLRSIRTSTHKLIQLQDPDRTLDPTSTGIPVPKPPSVQFFDLTADPNETQNLFADPHPKRDELSQVLNLLTLPGNLYDPDFFHRNGPLQEPPQPSAEMMEQLNALGYTSQ